MTGTVVLATIAGAECTRSILDEPIPSSASSTILAPESKRPIPAPRPVAGFARPTGRDRLTSTLATAAISVSSYVVNRYNDIFYWIEPYVPEAVKKKVSDTGIEINKKIESLKSLVFKTVYPATSVVYKNPTAVNKPKIEFKLVDHAVNRVVRQFSYEVRNEERDVSSFLIRAREGAIKILRENRNKKVRIVLTCEMECARMLTGEVITRIVPFRSNTGIVLEATELEKFYNRAKEVILENMIKYNKMGSNCIVSAIVKMDINMIDYNPLSARSYIPLDLIDPDLSKKKAIINIQNEDNECFKWCVTRALMNKEYKHKEGMDKYLKNQERVNKDLIKKSKELNWEGIDFPVSLQHIKKFEKNNEDISVYVFGYEDGYIYTLRKSKYRHRKHMIDLLLISLDRNCRSDAGAECATDAGFTTNEEKTSSGSEGSSHYCLIKSLSRLLSSQSSKSQHKTYYCRNCLQGYTSEEAPSMHSTYCNEHGCVRIELPKKDSSMHFSHDERLMRVPFVVYADFESFISPINTCTPDPNTSYTKQYQKHTPSSFCYYIQCFDENVHKRKPVTFTATSETDDVTGKFVEMLEKDRNLRDD